MKKPKKAATCHGLPLFSCPSCWLSDCIASHDISGVGAQFDLKKAAHLDCPLPSSQTSGNAQVLRQLTVGIPAWIQLNVLNVYTARGPLLRYAGAADAFHQGSCVHHVNVFLDRWGLRWASPPLMQRAEQGWHGTDEAVLLKAARKPDAPCPHALQVPGQNREPHSACLRTYPTRLARQQPGTQANPALPSSFSLHRAADCCVGFRYARWHLIPAISHQPRHLSRFSRVKYLPNNYIP